jgi:transcriptional regulator with XRE-family HTH domain
MVVRETLDADSSMWHWIAVDLHFWRAKSGMTLEALGKVIGLSRGAVSNLEAARPGFKLSDDQAEKLDQLWGLNEHFQRLLRYARAGHEPDWFREHLKYEARATTIKVYELAVVPGLLQTEEYARLLFTAAGSKDPEAQVQARMRRQEALEKSDPLQLWVLLDQGVIDRCVGDPPEIDNDRKVMKAQLTRLLEVSEWRNISLRVVPRSVGFHDGIAGAFKVLTIPECDVAYTEATGGGRLSLDASDVCNFVVAFDRVGAEALNRRASRDLIKRAMEAM